MQAKRKGKTTEQMQERVKFYSDTLKCLGANITMNTAGTFANCGSCTKENMCKQLRAVAHDDSAKWLNR